MSTLHKYRYEVHIYTLCQGWINCWTVSDDSGVEHPDSFPTVGAAQSEIDDLILDIQSEIEHGIRKPDEGYDSDDYRIYDNVKKEYVAYARVAARYKIPQPPV